MRSTRVRRWTRLRRSPSSTTSSYSCAAGSTRCRTRSGGERRDSTRDRLDHATRGPGGRWDRIQLYGANSVRPTGGGRHPYAKCALCRNGGLWRGGGGEKTTLFGAAERDWVGRAGE